MNVGEEVIYSNRDSKADKYIRVGERLRVIKIDPIDQKIHAEPIDGHGVFVLPAYCFSPAPKITPKKEKLDSIGLLEWASSRVEKCQQEGFFGKLTFHFENGKIVRTTSERSEVPQ